MRTFQLGKSLSHSIYRSRLQFIVAAGLAATCTATASAQTSWAAPVDGDWYLPSNWNPRQIPQSLSTSVELGFGTPYTVTIPPDGLAAAFSLAIPNANVTLHLLAPTIVFSTTLQLGGGGLLNNGLIRLSATTGAPLGSQIHFTVPAIIAGTGEIRLERESLCSIQGSSSIQSSGHRITGAGDVTVINEGLVSANIPGAVLSFFGTNRSLAEARSGATLRVSGLKQNSGGIVRADGATVLFEGVDGGVVEAVNGGAVLVMGVHTAKNLTARGEWRIGNPTGGGYRLELQGTITNDGLIRITEAGGMNKASIRFASAVLQGSGVTRLESEQKSRLESSASGSIAAGHTIAGTGTIDGVDSNFFTSAGTIRAEVAGKILACSSLNNTGLMEAVNGAILVLTKNRVSLNSGVIRAARGATIRVDGTINQSSEGVVLADGGEVILDSSNAGVLNGGRLESADGGVFIISPGGGGSLDGTTFEGELRVLAPTGANRTYLTVRNHGLVNNGLIRLLSGPAEPQAELSGGATFSSVISGSGEVRLEGTDTRIVSHSQFTNVAGHTIRGLGTIQSQASAPLQNNGIFAPGLPIGQLTLNHVTQGPTAVLDLELAGDAPPQRDSVLNLGALTLDGTLRIRFLDSYTMPPCSEYLFISGGAITGQFATLDAPEMPIGQLSIRYEPGAVTIVYNPADYDNSTFLDSDDFTAFTLDFEAGNDNADINHSGAVDTDDFTAFMQAFEQGC